VVDVLHYIFIHGERIGTSRLMAITVFASIVVMSELCCWGGRSSHFVLDIDFRLLNDRLSYITKGGCEIYSS